MCNLHKSLLSSFYHRKCHATLKFYTEEGREPDVVSTLSSLFFPTWNRGTVRTDNPCFTSISPFLSLYFNIYKSCTIYKECKLGEGQ